MYDYDNARVAAARSRLLTRDDLRRLHDARSPGALVAMLERHDDWRSILAELASLAAPSAQVIDAAIERQRGRRLGALLRWYGSPALELVEALVLPLDVERLLAIVRRRRSGESSDRIGAAVAPGAILDAEVVGSLARAASLGSVLDRASAAGVLRRDDARAVTRLAAVGAGPEQIELAIIEATDRARLARAGDRGEAAQVVRRVVDGERAVRSASIVEAREAGNATAALGERGATLSRLDELARKGRRTPLGVGAIVGYVAAVEAEAIRLRAVLAGVVAGWSPGLVGEYLDVGSARPRFAREAL